MAAIELVAVNKKYGKRPALQDLHLTVKEGEMFGFLGPNGAGKTTTLRLLLGLLRPDSGQVYVLGQAAGLSMARTRLGFLPDLARIDGGFRGQEWLDYLAALQPFALDPAYREQLCERLELAQADRQRRIKTYSRGMRQKLAIIQALQHRPDLILMDEPTEGLDPLAKRALFELLRTAQAEGATVFFSSHVLSEVERLCDRVALIKGGRLAAVDSITALRDRQTRRVEIAFAGQPEPEAELQALAKRAGGAASREGERWRLTLKGDLNPLLALLANYPVKDLVIEPADLEDIFLSYYSAM
jgi:ABC-2 type transport system ATP-binding protein